MRILLILTDRPAEPWKKLLLSADPNLEIDIWPEIFEPEVYTTTVVWKHPQGLLNHFPNLKLVCSLGAGVDHILADQHLPKVRVCRIVDEQLTISMSHYVMMAVLNYQRKMYEIWHNQQKKIWEKVLPIEKPLKIGILGLGTLGSDAAIKLTQLGFEVFGYAQSSKQIQGVRSYEGAEGLEEMLKKVNVVVCMLPLTSKTKDFLNDSFFSKLQKESYLIHVARGEQIVEEDLLNALETKQLSGALIDVFREEPLPRNHPFWQHPAITITPHIASVTHPSSAASQIADNHHRMLKGEPLQNEVDLQKEY